MPNSKQDKRSRDYGWILAGSFVAITLAAAAYIYLGRSARIEPTGEREGRVRVGPIVF